MAYNGIYTYYIEALTKEERSKRGALSDMLTGLVPCFYALIGYFFRDWQIQTYVIGSLNAGGCVLLWFLPESKKWLATQKEENNLNRDKLQLIIDTFKGNMKQFTMIFNSKPILHVCLILVRDTNLSRIYHLDVNLVNCATMLDGNWFFSGRFIWQYFPKHGHNGHCGFYCQFVFDVCDAFFRASSVGKSDVPVSWIKSSYEQCITRFLL